MQFKVTAASSFDASLFYFALHKLIFSLERDNDELS